MRKNLEQVQTVEGQKENGERESNLVLITIIDDDSWAWIPHQIVFEHTKIKNKKVVCQLFDDYNQDTESYLKDMQKEKNHFIIVDLSIGQKKEGGLGIINALHSFIGKDVKIFLISGYDARAISSDIGAHRILQKPVDIDTLVDYIEYDLKR